MLLYTHAYNEHNTRTHACVCVRARCREPRQGARNCDRMCSLTIECVLLQVEPRKEVSLKDLVEG